MLKNKNQKGQNNIILTQKFMKATEKVSDVSLWKFRGLCGNPGICYTN